MSDNTQNGIVLQKKHIVIGLILLLLLLVGGVAAGMAFSKRGGQETAQVDTQQEDSGGAKPALDIDPNAGEWNGEELENKGGVQTGIKIPGYPSITIAKDTENVRMALLNPEGNPCYFKFEIVLKDTDETIFESKYVPPGQTIRDVELSKPLAEGEYNATIKITTIALDQETPLNGANVETILIAK